MEEKFKAGDRVRLKSGGPVMTVQKVANDGAAACAWFDKIVTPSLSYPGRSDVTWSELRHAHIDPAALEKAQ